MEYAGYIPVEKGLDISGLTDKIANKVFTIGQERETKRQELADLTQKTEEGMFIPMTDNNALNGKISEFTGVSTDYLYGLNKDLRSGKITPAEYKRRLNTLDGNVAEMKKMADQYDKRIQEAADRIEKGEAGVLQAEQIRFMDAALNLNNSWGLDKSTGKMYMLTPEGRKVYADWINKDGNLTSRKIDLVNKTNDYMKNWSAESIYERFGLGGSITYESLRSNEAFDRESNRFADMMVQGDNLQSIILDNGVIDHPLFAYSEEQTKQVVQEEIDRIKRINNGTITQEEIDRIEDSVVFMDKNGKAQFTDKQIEMAKDAVKDAIRIRTAEKAKLSVQRGFDPRDKSTNQKYQDTQQKEAESARLGYEAIVRAMNVDTADPQDLRALEAKAKSPVTFTKRRESDGSYRLYAQPTRTIYVAPSKSFWYNNYATDTQKKMSTAGWTAQYESWAKQEQNQTIDKQVPSGPEIPINEGIELAQYVYGGDLNDAQRLYDLGRSQSPSYDQQVKDYYAKEYWVKKKTGQKPMTLGQWLKGQSENNNDPLNLGL